MKVIRPGVSEYQIIAEIEYAARKEGAEEHFTLIGSGKFAFRWGSDSGDDYPHAAWAFSDGYARPDRLARG